MLLSTTLLSFSFLDEGKVLECGNKLELVSSANERFTVKVTTRNAFESTFFILEEGAYTMVASQSGTNTQELIYKNIQPEKVYKLVIKFSANSPLCATRQLTGLTL